MDSLYTLLTNFFNLDKTRLSVIGDNLTSCEVLSIVFGWIVLGIVITIIFFSLFAIKNIRRFISHLPGRILLLVTVLTWILGFFIYTLGFYNYQLDFFAIIPRSIIASTKMFLIQNELARIDDVFRTSNVYMTTFAITHLLAVVISMVLVFKLIGFRIWTSVKLFLDSISPFNKSTVINIFWGLNDNSFLLAQSIYEKKKNDEKIIFVNCDTSTVDDAGKIGLNRIFDVISLKSNIIRKIEDIGAYLTNCHEDLLAITSETDTPLAKNDLFVKLHQYFLKRIIEKPTVKKIRLYFLSEDENKNILSAVAVAESPICVGKNESTQSNIEIFAHARHNTKNEVYERYSQFNKSNGKNINLIDTSYLSVASLKLNPNYHPVNYVKIDEETGCVTSPFNSLIIGFNEVGQDAFRFLYEFGAFVDINRNKSPFKCFAIDATMNKKMGVLNRQFHEIIKDNELELVQTDVDSEQYWLIVDQTIKTLNYVIISINDDELAISTAINLYKRAIQLRNNNLHNFAIYVRCYQMSSYIWMKEIAKKYNDSNAHSGGKIIVFGNKKDIYTYDMIVNNGIINQAKLFHAVYESSTEINTLVVHDSDKSKIEEVENAIKEIYANDNSMQNINRKHNVPNININDIDDENRKIDFLDYDYAIVLSNSRAKESNDIDRVIEKIENVKKENGANLFSNLIYGINNMAHFEKKINETCKNSHCNINTLLIYDAEKLSEAVNMINNCSRDIAIIENDANRNTCNKKQCVLSCDVIERNNNKYNETDCKKRNEFEQIKNSEFNFIGEINGKDLCRYNYVVILCNNDADYKSCRRDILQKYYNIYTADTYTQIDYKQKDVEFYWENLLKTKETPLSYEKIQEINTKIEQNISNSLHKWTKIRLLSGNLNDCSFVFSRKYAKHTKKNVYENVDEKLQYKLTNLAICEHMRWEASFKLMGYSYGLSKSYIKKTHPSMILFHNLKENIQAYDYNVVDVSVKLVMNDNISSCGNEKKLLWVPLDKGEVILNDNCVEMHEKISQSIKEKVNVNEYSNTFVWIPIYNEGEKIDLCNDRFSF